jgi:uncharacterized coiled-coil protein SlyX
MVFSYEDESCYCSEWNDWRSCPKHSKQYAREEQEKTYNARRVGELSKEVAELREQLKEAREHIRHLNRKLFTLEGRNEI